MSLRVPLCAWCGASLRGHGQIVIQAPKAPGRPKAGWHAFAAEGMTDVKNCAGQDHVFKVLLPTDGTQPEVFAEKHFAIIEARGPGRLIAGPRRLAAIRDHAK